MKNELEFVATDELINELMRRHPVTLIFVSSEAEGLRSFLQGSRVALAGMAQLARLETNQRLAESIGTPRRFENDKDDEADEDDADGG